MFVPIKCSFCGQSFDFDSSSGILLADCPHCGKQNTVAAPAREAKNLTVQRDAPTLAGAVQCPACKAQVSRGDILCIHCGYNFATRQKVGGTGWLAANQSLAVLLAGGLVVLAAGAAYLLWPEADAPPPDVLPAVASATAPAPEPVAPAPVVTDTNLTPAATNPAATPAAPAASEPAPGPTPEELAAQQAEAERAAREAERAAFEEKKFQAEQNLRLQLDLREPLYVQNERVELRRKSGRLHEGTLTGLSGTGTNRVVLVAGPAGEIGVPLAELDPASRRRVDPEYREAFIRHVMSTRSPAEPGEQPAE